LVAETSYELDGFKWNYCTPVDNDSYAMFGYDDYYVSYASASIDNKHQMYESIYINNEIVGVEFTQESETNCRIDKKFSWTTSVLCDPEREETELISNEVYLKNCEASVLYAGPAGCPIVDLSEGIEVQQEEIMESEVMLRNLQKG